MINDDPSMRGDILEELMMDRDDHNDRANDGFPSHFSYWKKFANRKNSLRRFLIDSFNRNEILSLKK